MPMVTQLMYEKYLGGQNVVPVVKFTYKDAEMLCIKLSAIYVLHNRQNRQ